MEKCGKCGTEIESEAVRTTGSVYHADCFKCEVCKCSLCDMTFSTDDQNRLYCPQDYTKRFAAHGSVCKSAIVPKEGQTKASRIHALDKDFHPHCFKCEVATTTIITITIIIGILVLDIGRDQMIQNMHTLTKMCRTARWFWTR